MHGTKWELVKDGIVSFGTLNQKLVPSFLIYYQLPSHATPLCYLADIEAAFGLTGSSRKNIDYPSLIRLLLS